jgi:N-acylglucosamine-6-phosphate 2-epimerase
MYPVLESLKHRLIVSCQAQPGEPLYGAAFMAAMACSAEIGGAAAIRANGPDDIAAICSVTKLPVLGIYKRRRPDFEVYITPTFEDAAIVVQAGAQIVAVDGTLRLRPNDETLATLIGRIHEELHVPVMADISCVEDALASEEAGADWIGTTLAGYTTHGRPKTPGPDLDLISILAERINNPIIAEGRISEPAQVAEAFERGAYAVVIGTAITRPQDITRRFVAAVPQSDTT